jgi:NAD(P)-dependent dehydrogenase (short-subunit alcohol dehydrogenase family)
MPTAIVTGASKGLGLALASGLAAQGWSLVINARDEADLSRAADSLRDVLRPDAGLRALPGDVTHGEHIARLVAAAQELGDLELVVNNASSLGPSPLPALIDYPLAGFQAVLETNAVAPLALIQAAAPDLDRATRPRVVNITSDASVEPYQGWGGYGASKAALDHVGSVLGVERPGWRVWTVDPGDLRTQMHQDAFPGEDISDRPEPDSVVPAFLALIDSDHPSGRLRLSDVSILERAGGAA